MTLTTTWAVDGGELELADGLVAEVEGRFLPGTVLVRRLTARGRAVHARLHLAPRFGYDRRPARRIGHRAGALVCEAGDLAIAVTSDGPAVEADRPVDFEVRPGEPVTIAVTVARRSPLIIVPPAVAAAELARDEAGWRAWAAAIEVADHRDAVVRSLITLRLLTYSPSGAPVAAPTTSLPERIGGVRNWDYRYAWPRDASIGIAAFLGAGKPQRGPRLPRLAPPRQPADPTPAARSCSPSTDAPGPAEPELAGWPGYAGSRPVRIGNGAAGQHQLDGYGWVLDAAWLLTDAGHRLYGETWRAMRGLRRPGRRHLDRARRRHLGDPRRRRPPRPLQAHGLARPRPRPPHRRRPRRPTPAPPAAMDQRPRRPRRRHPHAAGSTPTSGTYTAQLRLDRPRRRRCSCFPLLGLEPALDPASCGTIDAIRRQLSAGGPLLYRYPPGTDGLAGTEGAFLPCSFWLVQALARTGRPTKPTALSTSSSRSAARSASTPRRWTPPPRAPRQLPPSPHPRRPRPSRPRPRRHPSHWTGDTAREPGRSC